MKKLFLLFVAVAITAGVYAQVDSTNRKMGSRDMTKQNQNIHNNTGDKAYTDGVVMLKGKMMMVKNGQVTVLDHNMTMTNGTKIMSDGSCTKKDGSKMMMKEGEHMDMAGNVKKDKNMYLVPDSTKKKE